MNISGSSPRGDVAQFGRGLLMGGADIIPGVSGGPVALIVGIYERLVTAISRFDMTLVGHLRRRQWADAAAHVDLRFLVALLCGILTGIAGLGALMKGLLENHLTSTLAAFFGLILASSIIVARSIERWDVFKGILALAGAGFAFWLVAQPFMDQSKDGSYGYLFLCGTVAICAMILPGISGAFILLIMGKYEFVTGVIRDLTLGRATFNHVLILAVFAFGCAMGLLTFSKFLRWLLDRYHGQTLAVLCGFMIGSLRKIWPYKVLPPGEEKIDISKSQLHNTLPEAFDGQVVACLALAAAAFVFVLVLDWIVRRHESRSRLSQHE